MIERRLITQRDAAQYVGASVETFVREVEAGIWPSSVMRRGRVKLYDIEALKRRVDQLSGIKDAIGKDNNEAEAMKAIDEIFD